MIGEGLRFFGVNAVGLVVDLGAAIALRALGLDIFLAASAGFVLAALVNYQFHARWTFRNAAAPSAGGFAAFVAACLVTIGVRLLALKGLLLLELPALVQRDSEALVLATGISFLAGYFICKRLIFAR